MCYLNTVLCFSFLQRILSTDVTRTNNLEDIVDYLKSDRVKTITVMAGAGISTASGIPDFRLVKILSKQMHINKDSQSSIYMHNSIFPIADMRKHIFTSTYNRLSPTYIITMLCNHDAAGCCRT